MAIVAGYGDFNGLRHDYVLQTALDKDEPLASSPALHRMEVTAHRQSCVKAHRILLSFSVPFKDIILDFDASDIGECSI